MKFRKGDKVCALLVANKWGVDFTCFCGKLVKIEERGSLLVAKIMVSTYYDLYKKQKHKPSEFSLDVRLFKLLPWNEQTKEYVKSVRKASQTLHEVTCKVRSTK
jgi:hypothetical protein